MRKKIMSTPSLQSAPRREEGRWMVEGVSDGIVCLFGLALIGI